MEGPWLTLLELILEGQLLGALQDFDVAVVVENPHQLGFGLFFVRTISSRHGYLLGDHLVIAVVHLGELVGNHRFLNLSLRLPILLLEGCLFALRRVILLNLKCVHLRARGLLHRLRGALEQQLVQLLVGHRLGLLVVAARGR